MHWRKEYHCFSYSRLTQTVTRLGCLAIGLAYSWCGCFVLLLGAYYATQIPIKRGGKGRDFWGLRLLMERKAREIWHSGQCFQEL